MCMYVSLFIFVFMYVCMYVCMSVFVPWSSWRMFRLAMWQTWPLLGARCASPAAGEEVPSRYLFEEIAATTQWTIRLRMHVCMYLCLHVHLCMYSICNILLSSSYIYIYVWISSANTTSTQLTSWTSSNIMTRYLDSRGSLIISRSSTPSVAYLMTVWMFVQSSNRIAYPTSQVPFPTKWLLWLLPITQTCIY